MPGWISKYEKNLINEAKLSKEIDEFMKNYDSKKGEVGFILKILNIAYSL